MNRKYFVPDLSDKRIVFADKYLTDIGHQKVSNADRADFILLGVNPKSEFLNYNKLIFAGNIQKDNIIDYTKEEAFKLKNAFLTAEGALSIAITENTESLFNKKILITGYGRIAKALHGLLLPFTKDITVCARKELSRLNAELYGTKAMDFSNMNNLQYDYIFNTVPHPVFDEASLLTMNKNTIIIELASLPGGVDCHLASLKGIKVIEARGLPSKYSPKSAGIVVGETVDKLIKEVLT